MMEKNVAVFGIYPHRASFEYALSALKIGGFRATDISVMLRANPGTIVTKGLATGNTTETTAEAGSGASLGGALSWLADTGPMAVPGHEEFLIAGRIVTTHAGIGLGGKLGGPERALLGLGVHEHEVKPYRSRIENGGILLSVHCENPNWVNKARRFLTSTGAENISSAGESETK